MVRYNLRMGDAGTAGRRQRKKTATRQAIIDSAEALFLARGFDQVSVREIADQADVSPTTVFTHFPQKEALLFSDEEAQRQRLIAAVRERSRGESIAGALKEHFRSEFATMWLGDDREERGGVMALIQATPALQDYASRMWVRHEKALAHAIATDFGLEEPSDEIRLYARFALQIQLLVRAEDDPMLDTGFDLLEPGWEAYCRKAGQDQP